LVISAVLLDTSVLGLVTNPQQSPQAIACSRWLRTLLLANMRVIIPEIADYELRRELIRARRTRGIARLDALAQSVEYLPLTTDAMRQAAQSWAEARQQGQPTAGNRMLDGDMILVGQALTLGLPATEIMIATTNVRHLARFVPADLWQNVRPA
jgi:predicted nucleic acid-binding protein